MGFLPFGPEHASGALVRGRPGVLRKAFDRESLRVRAARPQPFQSPLPGAARIAFHTHLFQPRASDHVFPGELESKPDLLVLPLNAALALTLGAVSPAAALVVITSVADAPMADHHRDYLWNALGLPVFEQLTGWDGTVIARECEAHDGLHVSRGVAIAEIQDGEFLLTQLSVEEPVVGARTGLAAGLITSLCACGEDTPRLQYLTALPLKVMRARAAA